MACKPVNRLLMLRAGGLAGPLFQGVAPGVCAHSAGNFLGTNKPGSGPVALRGHVVDATHIEVIWTQEVELNVGTGLPYGMQVFVDSTAELIQSVTFVGDNAVMRIQLLLAIQPGDEVHWSYAAPGLDSVETGKEVGDQGPLLITNDLTVVDAVILLETGGGDIVLVEEDASETEAVQLEDHP